MPGPNAPTETASRVISVRLPERLERQVEQLAARDANSVSATVRRLLSAACERELRAQQ
jgi:Arc/MetJ-type ribon-helix-helix transcriptional regulator